MRRTLVYSFEHLFFNTESGEKEVLIPTTVSMVRIEVKGSGTLICEAMLDRDSQKQPIAAINAKDFSSTLSMTEGLYSIECSGYYKLFFILNSPGSDIFIKAVY